MISSTDVINAKAVVAVTLVDVAGPGTLEYQTAAGVEVATLTFSLPAFGAPVVGVCTANPIVSDPHATGGTVARYVVKDGAGTVRWEGTVSLIGGTGEIQLASLVKAVGEVVALAHFYYVEPVA